MTDKEPIKIQIQSKPFKTWQLVAVIIGLPCALIGVMMCLL